VFWSAEGYCVVWGWVYVCAGGGVRDKWCRGEGVRAYRMQLIDYTRVRRSFAIMPHI
jgi:hypothetical protein